ncbi:MAG TPA: hypothetical protein VKR56_05285 [Candidatus Cybelea sp.]|nr:hypothetical protein [Candidatus Cybelea sp.]
MPPIPKLFAAWASLCCAASLLVGCTNSIAGGPPVAAGLDAPGLNAGAGALLYLTSYGQSTVKTYDWPGLQHERTLKGFTHEEGLCADSKGDVFVANTNVDNIEEYAHGGTKPIATLADLPYYFPSSCAVDPVSGDLAVTNLAYYNSGSGSGNLVIFKHAAGRPQPYSIATIFADYMCGYDDRGNLVVDGLKLHGSAAFAILEHGSTKLETLTLDHAPSTAGGVQWDGKHWAIGDGFATIYQYDVAGTKGTRVGTTTLGESASIFGFFISGDRVIAPEHSTHKVQIFKYPAGGTALETIGGLNLPFGAAISRGN